VLVGFFPGVADSGSVRFSFGRPVPNGFEVVLRDFVVRVTYSDSVSNDGRKYEAESILALILGRDRVGRSCPCWS
jgi:hypothetical protein